MRARRPGRPRKDRLRSAEAATAGASRSYGPTRQQRAWRSRLVGPSAPQHLAEYPLGILLARKLITEEEHEAGCRYARLFRLAVGGESLRAVNLVGRVFDGPEERGEAWLAARAAEHAAARTLLARRGRRVRELVENVTVYQRLPAWCWSGQAPSAGDLRGLRRLRDGLADLYRYFSDAARRAA